MTVIEILRGARALLTNPKAWAQWDYAFTASGRKCPANSEFAVCWCMAGAVKRAAGPDAKAVELNAAEHVLARACGTKYLDTFNDKPGRRHSEILGAFDRAISSEQEKARTP